MMIKNLLKKSKMSIVKKTALTAFSGLVFSSLVAQTTVQIGTQTGTTEYAPITSCWNYSYSQQIYTAAEINAGGFNGPGTIDKLRFYYSSGATGSSTGWTVYIGNTTKTSFTSNTDWESSANLTNCFSGTVTYPGGGNWLEITLTTPYEWDGTSNVVVGIDENQGGYNCSVFWRKSDLGANRSIYFYSDPTNPNPSSPPSASARANFVPNVQFEMTSAPDCVGAPATANIIGNLSMLCENSNLNLSIDNSPFENGITHQWQAFDGTDWVDLLNDTLPALATQASLDYSQYQVVVGCEFSGLSTTMNPYVVTVNPLPIVITDIDSVSFCAGNAAIITASGAATYTWLPAAGLNVTNQPTVNATPTSGVTYTVTGTDANGCVNTATSYIVPAALAPTAIVVDPSENCTFGTQVNGTVTGVTTDSDGGIWSYRFLNADGLTEAQTWNTSNVFNFIPTADSVYTFYYQVKNASCANANDSVKFDFTIGFGGDVATVDYDCNNLGGSINLSNTFGQLDITEIYANQFGVGADLSAITTTGVSAVAGGLGILTPSATGVSGFMEINAPILSAGNNNAFNVKFDMTVDQPINNYGTGGADGLTYSFGDNAIPSSNGTAVNGKGTKLRLSFDSGGNSNENGNTVGIYLVYGWTANNAFGPTSPQTLQYSTNTALWKNQTEVPVELNVDIEGKATVTVAGTVVFDQIQLPPAYMNADVSTWKHLFSAGTGGDANRHAIDNLSITAGGMFYGLSTSNATTEPTSWQTSTSFTDLAPGTYHVWLSKDETADCAKNIETIEILNTNPIVDLGNDTTICEGESLVLDAGNTGATYVWSGTQNTQQTLTVDQAGAYVANVTMPNGCVGIGSVIVDVLDAPSATSVFSQGSYPNYSFSVIGAQNTDSYDWSFGDGTTLTNGPASINHTYSTSGMMNVVATLSNDCGTANVSAQVSVINDLSLGELNIDGLVVYPNPTKSQLNISLNDANESAVSIYSITGATIIENMKFNKNTVLDVTNWERGIYFLQISNQGNVNTQRVVVE